MNSITAGLTAAIAVAATVSTAQEVEFSPFDREKVIQLCELKDADFVETLVCFEKMQAAHNAVMAWQPITPENRERIVLYCDGGWQNWVGTAKCVKHADLWLEIFKTMKDLPSEVSDAIEKMCRESETPANCANEQADAWRTLYRLPQAD
jgi:hypothetical protein